MQSKLRLGLLGRIEFRQTNDTVNAIMSSRQTAKYHQRHRISIAVLVSCWQIKFLSFFLITYSQDMPIKSVHIGYVRRSTKKCFLSAMTQPCSLTVSLLVLTNFHMHRDAIQRDDGREQKWRGENFHSISGSLNAISHGRPLCVQPVEMEKMLFSHG